MLLIQLQLKKFESFISHNQGCYEIEWLSYKKEGREGRKEERERKKGRKKERKARRKKENFLQNLVSIYL